MSHRRVVGERRVLLDLAELGLERVVEFLARRRGGQAGLRARSPSAAAPASFAISSVQAPSPKLNTP
jgi:hypothetical protein